MRRTFPFFSISLLVLGGCTVVTNFGQYHGRDGSVGQMDGGDTSDGGTSDGGTSDGGPGDAGTACDPACGEGETCADGQCHCGTGAACGAGESCCGDSCVRTDTVLSCGGCDVVCPTRDHATPRCTDGACQYDCMDGFDDCNGEESDGCEASMLDPETCGSCEIGCGSNDVCAAVSGSAPACVSACPDGQMLCDGSCADLQTSTEHCGDCAIACTPGTNQIAMCVDGGCTYTCMDGFLDCDATVSGCESVLTTYYQDDDLDGVGTLDPAGAITGCPNAAPPGYAEITGDCDDDNPARYPGHVEVCDSLDNDCDNATDNGVAEIGMSCPSTCGGPDGVYACPPGAPALACQLPSDTCNGIDDNCDGNVDDGFACAAGSTVSCTITSGGCTAVGTRACSATCTLGSCVIAEACNRADDTCNGFSDEDVLRSYPSTVIDSRPGTYLSPRSDWAPGLRHIGIVYGLVPTGGTGGMGYPLFFMRVGATGAPIGTPLMLAGSALEWDVAHDGYHWTVAMIVQDPSGAKFLKALRIDSTTNTVTTSVEIPWNSSGIGGSPRIDRVMGYDQVVVGWVEEPPTPGSNNASVSYARLGTGPSPGTLSLIEALKISAGTTVYDFTAVTNTTDGALLAWSDLSNGRIQYTTFNGGSRGSIRSVATDPQTEEWLEVAYESATRLIGFVYNKRGSTTVRMMATLPIGGTTFTERPATGPGGEVDGSGVPAYIDDAGEGNFGVVGMNPGGGGPNFTRYRATDLTPVSAPMPAPAPFYVQGVPAGEGRFVMFSPGAGGLMTTAVDCI